MHQYTSFKKVMICYVKCYILQIFPDIICVSETKLKSDAPVDINVPEYEIIRLQLMLVVLQCT